jgi:DNA mismatch repair ATPase MutS
MSVSNIEKINSHFQIPIFYNEKNKKLNEHIIEDLELVNTKTVDSDNDSNESIYQTAFQPKTVFGKKILEQTAGVYTTDINYLKDTQNLLKTYSKQKHVCFQPDSQHILSIFDEIKLDDGFKEKYQYIDWSFWEFLNQSPEFLQFMSIYNLSSPIISFLVPIIILILPFFVIKMMKVGAEITFDMYVEVLKTISANHAIGRLFVDFSKVKMEEKMYILVSAFFYLFSIYQNVLTCFRFYNNMTKIHQHLNDIKQYLEHTETNIENFLSYSTSFKTYALFNDTLREKLLLLKQFKERLNTISPFRVSIRKTMEFGHILKCFYDIYQDELCEDMLLYSFGFNGYLDTLEGFQENMREKHVHLAKLKRTKPNSKIKNTNKKSNSNVFYGSTYPVLVSQKTSVKNTIRLDKNIIITGPNASGKTTILKSSLINVILTQQMGAGFYESATFTPYHHIHCYLNIPDTSGRDSLFQSEARRCKDILDVVYENKDERHFCVFDELYSGTNPDEAIRSGTAFLNYLVKYSNVNCILTTHFTQMCKDLETNERIENCHMLTQLKTDAGLEDDFNYTYKLEKGISTICGGIKVLRDLNYPIEILKNA